MMASTKFFLIIFLIFSFYCCCICIVYAVKFIRKKNKSKVEIDNNDVQQEYQDIDPEEAIGANILNK